jgi:signal transduction histidine kinase
VTSSRRLGAAARAVRGVPFVVWDALLALVLIVASVITIRSDGDVPGFAPMNAIGWGAIVLACGATVLRTYAPFAGLALSVTGLLISTIGDYRPPIMGISMIVLAGTVIYDAPRNKVIAALVVPPLVLTMMHLNYGSPLQTLFVEHSLFVLFATLSLLLRNHRRLNASLARETALLASQREAETRAALVAERTRVARELHDVVAHAMSAITVQAGVGRVLAAQDPTLAVDRLGQIEELSRDALNEMRRLLDVLRADDQPASRAPSYRLGDLEELLATFDDPDLRVTYRLDGDVSHVPDTAQVTAYRIVQEALTNVRKHAGPAQATVTLTVTDGELEICVADDGRGLGADPPARPGWGLIGMRDRVELLHGTLSTGPRPGGGFQVSSRLPLRSEIHA